MNTVNEVEAIKNILKVDRTLLQEKMFGYEGTDVYNAVPISRTKRCYTYTGTEKSGYFFPLHVVSEAGHKMLLFSLVKAGVNVNDLDYRGETAEQRANGEALYAFYELQGLRNEVSSLILSKKCFFYRKIDNRSKLLHLKLGI